MLVGKWPSLSGGGTKRVQVQSLRPSVTVGAATHRFLVPLAWSIVLFLLILQAIEGDGAGHASGGPFIEDDRGLEVQTRPSVRRLHVSWESITFEISKSRRAEDGRRSILKDVSGDAFPGRLLAVMGPSGCGKSTLLNVLSGRVPAAKGNRLVGDVTIGGIPLRDFDTQRHLAYVRQEQDFYPFLTVRETLFMAAGLRLDRTASEAEREAIVGETMEKLGLSGAADTLVGDNRTPGISGGEKRRLGIAMKLIGLETPSVILLDEPTSGLDSHQAFQVMLAIRELCADGHAVVVCIHQPRSSIYALFDDVLLLSEGEVMYHGPKEDALPRLASIGYKCPANFNPADFMIDLISPVTVGEAARKDGAVGEGEEFDSNSRVRAKMAELASQDWKARTSARSRTRSQVGRWLKELDRGDATESVGGVLKPGVRHATHGTPEEGGGNGEVVAVGSVGSSLEVAEPVGKRRRVRSLRCRWHKQFVLLLKRSWRQAMRDKFAVVARVFLGFGFGGIFGSVFWKLSLMESAIQDRLSLLINLCMNAAMFANIRALQTLAVERRVIALERMDEGTSASAYLTSKMMAETPMEAVFPLLSGCIIYHAAGLNVPRGGVKKLARFLLTLMAQAQAGYAMGLMIGCVSPSLDVANLLGPSSLIVFLMLGGVHEGVPVYLKKVENLSILKWGIQAMVTNELKGLKFIPDSKQFLRKWRPSTDKEVIPGEVVMKKMGVTDGDVTKPTRRLLFLTAAFHSVSLANLLLNTPRFQQLESPSGAASTRMSGSD